MRKIALLIAVLLLLFPLHPAKRLTVEDFLKISEVSQLQVSPDGSLAAFTVKKPCLCKNTYRYFIYLLDLKSGKVRRFTSPGKDFNPKFTPDGKLAFISTRSGKPQLYEIALDGGEARKITDFPTGVNDFVYSPDGRYILFSSDVPENYGSLQNLKKAAEKFEQRSNVIITERLFYRYWNSWRAGLRSHLFLAERSGKVLKDIYNKAVDIPPLDLGSLHDFCFSPDGKKIYFVANTDPEPACSTNNDIFIYDLEKGTVEKFTTNPANDNEPRFSPDGRFLAWKAMRRPGYESDQYDIYLLDLKTGKKTNLTANFDRSPYYFVWSPDSRYIYFIAPDRGYRPIFRVEVASGKLERVVEKVYASYLQVAQGKLVFVNEAVNRPKEVWAYCLKHRKLHKLTGINDAVVKDIVMNPLEEFWFKGARGDKVHGFIVKPPFFDPSKKYPAVMLIHGGPQGMWGDDFHPRWNVSMFASPGFVIVMVNFHGSRGYGQAFVDSINKDWGGKPYKDIILGMRYALKKFPFIDKARLAAAGASYGGYMIDWIEGHNPGLFKALVSHAGVYDLTSMYGATEELWFPEWEFGGPPWRNPSLYRKLSPSSYVRNFSTPCLVIHGMKDFRVPYTQGLQFFTALKRRGVEAKLLLFKDEDHFVKKPRNRLLWWKEVLGWLEKHLK